MLEVTTTSSQSGSQVLGIVCYYLPDVFVRQFPDGLQGKW